jgi:hypothetical protein
MALAQSLVPWQEYPTGGMLLIKLLTFLRKLHDVQTISTMRCVLSSLLDSHFDDSLLRTFDVYLFSYAEVLSRLGENVKRAEIRKFISTNSKMRLSSAFGLDLEQQFSDLCSDCRIPIARYRWLCSSCLKNVFRCSVCRLPVHGVGASCTICGHGGHIHHLISWFSSGASRCPTGCNCKCNYS